MARCELCDQECETGELNDAGVCEECDPEYDVDDDQELVADLMLERQELEDFEQADEYFGCYGDGDY